MAKIYRSAQGKPVDIDMLRLRNEEEIAVGNMKVNARGDELGPGGVIVKTRNEVMDEYYSTNAVYTKESVANNKIAKREELEPDDFSDLEKEITEQDAQMPAKPQLRGSLADAVAKSTKVEQKLLTPKKPIQRI